MACKLNRILVSFAVGLALCFPLVTQQTSLGDTNSAVTVRHFVAPEYPVAARLARIQGTVVTQVSVKADGKVASVNFVSAHGIFRKAVDTALTQWTFKVSAATDLKITIEFRLNVDCPLTGSLEPGKQYYVQTLVAADLPSNVEVRTCLPIVITNTN